MTEQNTETAIETDEVVNSLPPADGVDQITTISPDDSEGVRNLTPEGVGISPTSPDPDNEPDTFPREYVEKLRQENGKYRQRARQADTLAQRLHTELVRATGKLADPTDLPFDEDHLAEGDNLVTAIDDLLARKPHLAARKPVGDIGQGATPSAQPVSLLGLLKG